MQTIDLLVIAAYLIATAWVGLKLSGRQTGLKDYFLGGRDLPWWAVCLSVVATETSALTVFGIPVMSYLGNLSYLQLRSEEHTSELQSRGHLVCRLLLEKKK